MLAFYKIFLSFLFVLGSISSQGFEYRDCYITIVESSTQYIDYHKLEFSSNIELLRDIVLFEEPFDIDETDNYISNKFAFLSFLFNFKGLKLNELNSIHFNFSHTSFLEMDLPPPGFGPF